MTRPLALALIVGCTRADPSSDGSGSGDIDPSYVPAELGWEALDTVFEGDPLPDVPDVFTVVAADMDVDGDPDVIVNRHHLARTEHRWL